MLTCCTMVEVLKQFRPDQSAGVYSYGSVISVASGGIVGIRTTSGLELSLRDTSQAYAVGDQLVLGKKDKNLNSVFIIRKIDRICRSAVNVVILEGQG